jgi:AraC-like DNA-binding protein
MEDSTPSFNGAAMYILPDTCVELVVHFNDPYKTTFSNNQVSVQEQSFIVAQMKSFMKIQANGKTGILAVRFTALGAYHFFGTPMKEVANGETGLKSLWKDWASEIEEKIHFAQNTQQRAEIMQEYLKLQLARNGYIDQAVDYCIRQIKLSKGQLSIEALANQAGVSNRQLVRRFDKCIGLTPKEFSRITKFIGSLDLLNYQRQKSFTEIALDAGYYDQAHFIHDFREFSGMSPTEYLVASNVVY